MVNENGLRTKIPHSIIQDNELQVSGDKIVLPKGVYEHWFVVPERKRSSVRFNKLFRENCNLIFKNNEIVLTRAEYYLLQPEMLESGAMYLGGFSYSLGALIESFNSGNHFFFDEFGGYKKMYLISLKGSPLSGSHHKTFWCAEENRIIYSANEKGLKLPPPFYTSLLRFKKMMDDGPKLYLDFQDQAIEQLIKELSV